MQDVVLLLHASNLNYAQRLVADIPEDQMCAQPVPGRVMNHAAFLLGHVAWVNDGIASLISGAPQRLADWKEVHGMGANPTADRSCYRSKEELLNAYAEAHARLAEAYTNASPEVLARPAPERMRARFPTVGHVAITMMTSHGALHNGQMSAWRRAMGWPRIT